MWEILAYNGTKWNSPYCMNIIEAIELFCKQTKLHYIDIKQATNKH